jgi:DNA-binding GntR family transcriptional regulator
MNEQEPMVTPADTPPKPGKSQRAYEYLKTRISDGTFSSGVRLVLGQIAAELDMSVVPVREAIRRLEAEGMVTFEHRIGAHVTMLNTAEYVATMQALSVVEGYATGASTPFITPQDLARARALNDELAQCLRHFDPMKFTRLNLELHAVLYERCPNAHILEVVRREWVRLRTLRESTFRFVPGRAQQSITEHAALIDLIESGADPLTVELAARNHRLATLEAFLSHESDTPFGA